MNSSILTSQGTYKRYNKRGKEKCLLKISVKNAEHGKKYTSHNNNEKCTSLSTKIRPLAYSKEQNLFLCPFLCYMKSNFMVYKKL